MHVLLVPPQSLSVVGLLLEGAIRLPPPSYASCVFLLPVWLALGVGTQHKPVWGAQLAQSRPWHRTLLWGLQACTLCKVQSWGGAIAGPSLVAGLLHESPPGALRSAWGPRWKKDRDLFK